MKTRQVQFDDSATCHNEDVHLINHQSVYETDVQKVLLSSNNAVLWGKDCVAEIVMASIF